MDFGTPEKPLVAKLGKVRQPSRTYFFERENGTTFCAEENEAWNIYKGRGQIIGQQKPRIKFLGSSDGSIFYKATMEAQKVFMQEGLAKAQEVIRKGEQDELAVARGNMVLPRNFDTIDRSGNSVDIRTIGQ